MVTAFGFPRENGLDWSILFYQTADLPEEEMDQILWSKWVHLTGSGLRVKVTNHKSKYVEYLISRLISMIG